MGRSLLIGGRFAIGEHIGHGGMAEVYRGVDRQTAEDVAVKFLLGSSEAELLRFRREAALLGEITHPGIVRYIASGIAPNGESYIVMEWLRGGTLRQRLIQGMTPSEAVDMIRQVATALGVVHGRGIVHRDIKPSNVLYVEGLAGPVKLIDFGLARRPLQAGPTSTGALLGTPGYMAPEQVRSVREVDARADVFGLGCLLYECLAGRPPFRARDLPAMQAKVLLFEAPPLALSCPGLPPELLAVVERMLAKAPADRYPDGAAVADALDSFGDLGGDPRAVASDALGRAGTVALDEDEGSGSWVVAVRPATGEAPPDEELVANTVALHRGELAMLGDQSLAVALKGAGAADRAARCALALHDELKGATIVVAGGSGSEEAFDASLGGLEPAALRSLFADDEGGAIEVAGGAAILAERFEVAATADGRMRLCGPRR